MTIFEVMAGQGTIGIEILEDLPTVDMVLVPAGGLAVFWPVLRLA